jgi:hypothetical protein
MTFCPKKLSRIELASFNAKGTFKGTINNFSTDLILESSFGPAKQRPYLIKE